MVYFNPVLNSPADAYHGYRDPKTKTVTVTYDDKNIRDEETMYEFRTDGSATATSFAWGTKTELPAGTFTDVLMKLPETEVLNAKIAKDLATMYQRNPDRVYVPKNIK